MGIAKINSKYQKDGLMIKLSVIVPAYNEQKTVRQILLKLIKIKEVTEIVVVNDASSDGTVSEIKKVKDKRIKLYSHSQNQGKGAAIRTGLAKAEGNYILIQDADLEYDPADIRHLLQPIIDGRVRVVFGSRFLGPHSNMFFWHLLGNHFLNLTVNILFDSIISDMETCYKLMPTSLLKELAIQENDFRIEPEITCKLLKRKEKIVEVPITYVSRTYDEGKKITWVDGFRAVATILKIRFL
jgi:glycosyltransferase involved in cell wall biosynthesis